MTTTYSDNIQEPLATSSTTVYTAPPSVNDAFVRYGIASNPTATPATITLNIVKSGDTVDATNQYITTKTIPAGVSVVLSEIVGRSLKEGDFISALASVASTINLNISIRELST